MMAVRAMSMKMSSDVSPTKNLQKSSNEVLAILVMNRKNHINECIFTQIQMLIWYCIHNDAIAVFLVVK